MNAFFCPVHRSVIMQVYMINPSAESMSTAVTCTALRRFSQSLFPVVHDLSIRCINIQDVGFGQQHEEQTHHACAGVGSRSLADEKGYPMLRNITLSTGFATVYTKS